MTAESTMLRREARRQQARGQEGGKLSGLAPAILAAATILTAALIPSPEQAAASEGAPAIQWMIRLEEPSAVEAWIAGLEGAGAAASATEEANGEARERASAAARRQIQRNGETQERVAGALRLAVPEAREIFRVQRVLNGLAVTWGEAPAAVLEARLEAIRRLEGVADVRPMPVKRRTNSTSVPFVGADDVWDAGGLGLLGDGLRIGVIDTGVDYLHSGFGGSGLAADYAANDPTILDGFFPTPKVAGGFDFVGDAYDASSGDPAIATPQPDPDPMDCDGHGTHVAGTAAGFGVEGDGTTYPGPYGAGSTVPFGSLRVGPGVAPLATLYALRVFGCSGTTNVVELALEWAVDPDGDGDFSDRLDVVNLSLAARFGGRDDPAAAAADAASLAGVVVVASAGNDGDVVSIVGAPASADRAIAVAASWDDDTGFPTRAVRVLAPAELAGTHQAGGANFGPAVAAPGLSAPAALADPLGACAPLAAPLAGRIAVVRRDAACSFTTQTRNAQQAGAIAAVIVNDRPELSGVFDDGTGGDITIPPVLLRQRTGDPLIAALQAGAASTLTVTSASLADQAALFSSRGPRLGDGALKPDVAAPGVVITSVGLGNAAAGGTGAAVRSGTSMSAPHVSGLAALLRERRPGWSPREIKSALVNTGRDVFLDPEDTPPRLSTSRMGGGRVEARAALDTETLAYSLDRPERVGLSFGHLEVENALALERILRIDHRGAGAAGFEVSIDEVSPLAGITASLPGGPTVAVAPFRSADVTVRLEIDAAALRHERAAAQEETLFGFARFWSSEWSAYLTLTPTAGGGPALRVPLHLTARPASAMASAGPLKLGAGTPGAAELRLVGDEIDQGSQPPQDQRSLVSVFELAGRPAPDFSLPAGLDLTHVGVATDAALVGLPGATLYFALLTRGPLSTPLEARYEVALDVDRDGVDDFLLRSTDEGSFAFGSFATDGFLTVLEDLGSGASISRQLPLGVLPPSSWYTVPFQADGQVLAVRAADLGLVSGAADLRFTARVLEALGGTAIAGAAPAGPRLARSSTAGPFAFDAEAPGLDASGGAPAQPLPAPLHFDLDGAVIPVRFDLGALEAAGRTEPGLLLLHHHNPNGLRAEVVGLEGGDFADLGLSIDLAPDPVAVGGLVTARATVTQRGTRVALASRLELPLPAGAALEAAGSDGRCAEGAGLITCLVGDLPPGASEVLEIGLRLTAAAGGDLLEVQGEVSTPSFEGNVFDNSARAETRVSGVILQLTKSALGPFEEGAVTRYLLELRHVGSADQVDLSGDELVDALPAGLRPLAASASSGTANLDAAQRRVAWNGPLAAGAAVEIEIEALIEAPAGTVLANQASAFFDADGDGLADGEVLSADASSPAAAGATVFEVARAPAAIEIPALSPAGLVVLAALLWLASRGRLRRVDPEER
ncbi:MAG: S8 family serine peptidase [Acidobacteriota bacterium]